jgi:hypothetical protein
MTEHVPKLLRDEEAIGPGLTATLPLAQLAAVDSMAAWLKMETAQRDTRAPDRSASSPSWLTVVG